MVNYRCLAWESAAFKSAVLGFFVGDLFVKLPQRQLEATLTKDQKTIESETTALAQQNQVYSAELTRRRAAAAGEKQRR